MAKSKADLSALAQHDARLAYAFGPVFEAASAVKTREDRTARWDEVPEPDDTIVPPKRNADTGEIVPRVDANGKPVHKARTLFAMLAAKYRPKANNPNGNPVIFKKVRTIMNRINEASGIRRGRGAGGKVDQNDIALIETSVDETAV